MRKIRQCIVKDCEHDRPVTYHRMPKATAKRNIWLDSLKLSETADINKGRVCSKHFAESDFCVKGNGHVWLKNDAYPLQIDESQEMMNGEMVNDECPKNMQFVNEVEIDGNISMYDATQRVSVDLNKIYREHNYSKLPYKLTPKKGALIYNNRCLVMSLRRSLQRTRSQIKKMKKEHKEAMKKFSNFPKLSELQQEMFLLMMKHHNPKSSPRKYSPEIRKFALSLHYYSPAGYEFVRSTMNKCLPHPKTIATWYSVIDGQPGFTVEALDSLAEVQKKTPYPIVVSLVLDGMAIRKHLQRMGDKTVGYTDCGGVLPDVDEKHQLAKEALIFLVNGVNVPFKVQVGYFLINSLTGQQLTYLTTIAITLVMNCKMIVASITHDGLKSQFLMDELLGCNYKDVRKLITFFLINGRKVFVFPDMCHMLKLARNYTFNEYEFLDGNKRKISWKYFVNLHKLQTSLRLNFANRVRNLHINFKNQIMKVYLATQLFSESVADAIEFCDKTLHLPDFKHSEGTVEFIRVMNDVFDIFNSRDMKDTFYKQPLHKHNHSFIMKRLEYIETYLLSLTDLEGTPVYAGPRYTFVLGMLVLITSLKGYYDQFVVKEQVLTFIPTYKQSQDSVEIFNCNMRSFGGYNTNPTAVSFQNAYKKSLLHVQFHPKFTGNCIPLEDVPILNFTSAKRPAHPIGYIPDEEFEISIENALAMTGFRVNFDAYYNIVAYISGYIARRLNSMLKCYACSNAVIHLLSEEELCHPEDENHGDEDFTNNIDMDIVDSFGDLMDDIDMDIGASLGDGDDMESFQRFDGIVDHREIRNSEFDLDRNITMEGVFINDNDSHYQYEHEYQDEIGDWADYESEVGNWVDNENYAAVDDDEADGICSDFDLLQVEDIAKKYYELIKQKNRGGLFYPSDSLYRVAIFADLTFTTALKNSGNKILKQKFNLNQLVASAHILCDKYSDILFSDLKEHFDEERDHNRCLIENILKFYLKIRVDFLNKNVSANSGRRQNVIHSLHFAGL